MGQGVNTCGHEKRKARDRTYRIISRHKISGADTYKLRITAVLVTGEDAPIDNLRRSHFVWPKQPGVQQRSLGGRAGRVGDGATLSHSVEMSVSA